MSNEKKAVKKKVFYDDFSVSYGYNASDPDSIDKLIDICNPEEDEDE